MTDSIYVLSERELTVEKLHLCTWDVRGGDSFAEVGLSVANDDALPARGEKVKVQEFKGLRSSRLHSRCTLQAT